MKRSLNVYLEELEESEVRSLAEVIEYNNKHADVELPPSKLKALNFDSTSMESRLIYFQPTQDKTFSSSQRTRIPPTQFTTGIWPT